MGKPAIQDAKEPPCLLDFLTIKKNQVKSEPKWCLGESNSFFIIFFGMGSFFLARSKLADVEKKFQGDY